VALRGSDLKSVAILATLGVDICALLQQHLGDLLVALRGSDLKSVNINANFCIHICTPLQQQFGDLFMTSIAI
jgi:hypothetical protein